MTQPYTKQETLYLAATIWAEARGEGVLGMRSVAHVINNRKKSGKVRLFGAGIIGVVLKPKQFSCWNLADGNRRKLDVIVREGAPNVKPGTPDANAWSNAVAIAEKVLAGTDSDPTKGALYYHTRKVNTVWDNALTKVAEIGDHLFYV